MKSLLKAYEFNLHYARDLVSDISEEQMYLSPHKGLENHPAFTLGHLVVASAMIIEDLGKPYVVPSGWDEFFGRKGPGDLRLPLPYKSGMPSKAELISELENKHNTAERLIARATPEILYQPIEWRFDMYFSNIGDYLYFMCITHEAMHLGQLAAWRRSEGLRSSLARV